MSACQLFFSYALSRAGLLHVFAAVAVITPRVCRSLSMHADVLPCPCRWQFDHFMENFNEESRSGFFRETSADGQNGRTSINISPSA